MSEDQNKIEDLNKRLDEILSKHNAVTREIGALRSEILRLKSKNLSEEGQVENTFTIPEEMSEDSPRMKVPISIDSGIPTSSSNPEEDDYFKSRMRRTIGRSRPEGARRSMDWEKLIGENLINKIGILVLIIGVAIGGKYSIDNELISPLARIVLGYIVGAALMGIGMKLKKNYLNFSAVLVSGAMAIFYFITFFAYSFYGLMAQEIAFGLMVIFTIFTVLAALNYDKEIIAHLGLVGAISVPFLLSNDSGNATFLFSYLALINLGIAYISLRKNWKVLFYSTFVLTWIVYYTWLIFGYNPEENFVTAFLFLCLYFVLFYIIFLAYKFMNLKKYGLGDVVVLLINSILFFAIGYYLLEEHTTGQHVLGLYAVGNALVHFVAAYLVKRRQLADRNIFYFIVGLVLVCLTLAIPIQLDGKWVTIMWSAEAVALFAIGRIQRVGFYEYISIVLIGVSALSLIQDWQMSYLSIDQLDYYFPVGRDISMPLFANTLFLTSIITSACLAAINWIHFDKKWKTKSKLDEFLMNVLDYALPVCLILTIYFGIRMEIAHHFAIEYIDTSVVRDNDNSYNSRIFDVNIVHKSALWILNYTLLFFGLVAIGIYKYATSDKAKWASIIVNTLLTLGFLLFGLYHLSELRVNYIQQYDAENFNVDRVFLWIRYVSILLIAILITFTYLLLKSVNRSYKIHAIAETLFYLTVLWIASSEMIQWLHYNGKQEIYGLALSIFWGIYSVIIIAVGIWKKKKHLRILGIVIFGLTLIKLFFFDLSHLTTIAKTIVLIALGALMLLTSFLYNKYKIEDEEDF